MREGQILLGSFEILQILQESSQGTVCLAHDIKLRRDVCLKMLPIPSDMTDMGEALYREARMASALQSIHTIRVFYCGDIPGKGVLFVMEWADGGSLAQSLKPDQPLGEAVALDVLRQVAISLTEAHEKGIVHRDIKPGNILLCYHGGQDPIAKVADFGISSFTAEATQEGQTQIAGTPAYMAPELWRAAPFDARVDIYALSVLAFQLFTGRLPFPARSVLELERNHLTMPVPSPRSINPDVSEQVENAILHGMAKAPDQRPDSVQDWMAGFGLEAQRPRGMSFRTRIDSDIGDVRVAMLDTIDIPQDARTTQNALPSTSMTTTMREQWPVAVLLGRGSDEALNTWDVAVSGSGGLLISMKTDERVFIFRLGNDGADPAMRALRAGRVKAETLRVVVHAGFIPVGESSHIPTEESVSFKPLEGMIEETRTLAKSCAPGDLSMSHKAHQRLFADFQYTISNEVSVRGISAIDRAASVPEEWSQTFHGRQSELEALASFFEEGLTEDGASAAIIHGNPGIGKSRIVHECIQEILSENDGLRVHHARALSEQSEVSYSLLSRVLRILLSLPEDLTEDAIRLAIERQLETHGVPGVRAVSYDLAQLLSSGDPSQANPGILGASPAADASRRINSLTDVISAISKDAPMALVLEDIQYADQASLELLASFLHSFDKGRLLLLAISRGKPDVAFLESVSERRNHLILEIEPMGSRSFKRFTKGLLVDVNGDASDLIDHLSDYAGGVPLYAQELVRFWFQDGTLTDTGDGWEINLENWNPRKVPASIESILLSRISLLGTVDRRTLQASAIIGHGVSTSDLSFLLRDIPLREVDLALKNLAEAALLLPPSGTSASGEPVYRFPHGLLRDAAYGSVIETDRLDWHQRMAAWHEGIADAQHSLERATLSAEHWELAGKLTDAARAHELAGDLALLSLLPEDALLHFEKALQYMAQEDPEPLIRLHLKSGRALEGGHRNADAMVQYDKAGLLADPKKWKSDMARDVYWRAAIAYARSVIIARRGNLEEAHNLCNKARQELLQTNSETDTTALIGRIANWEGWTAYRMENFADAAIAYQDGITVVGEDGALRIRSTLLFGLALSYAALDRPRVEVDVLFKEAISLKEDLMEATGDVRPLLTVYNNYAYHLIETCGDARGAYPWLMKAQELSAEHKFHGLDPYIESGLGRIALQGDDHTTAIRHFERAIQKAEELGLHRIIPTQEELRDKALSLLAAKSPPNDKKD